MITFLAHAHIFDAKPVCLSCYRDHGGGTISIAPKDAFVPDSLIWLD